MIMVISSSKPHDDVLDRNLFSITYQGNWYVCILLLLIFSRRHWCKHFHLEWLSNASGAKMYFCAVMNTGSAYRKYQCISFSSNNLWKDSSQTIQNNWTSWFYFRLTIMLTTVTWVFWKKNWVLYKISEIINSLSLSLSLSLSPSLFSNLIASLYRLFSAGGL